MFVKESDLIDLQIYYLKSGRNYDALTSVEYKAKVRKDEIDKTEYSTKYKVLNFKMKELTWGLYNDLQELAMVDDGRGLGERSFNYKVYKESRLKYLLVEWDAKTLDDKKVSINETVLRSLSPSIAEAMLKAYDEISYLDEEEEKN